MNLPKMLEELRQHLSKSTREQRIRWAHQIVEKELPVSDLFTLLQEDDQIAIRFLWLLSEVGEVDPSVLLKALPHLLALRPQLEHLNADVTFANYWLICGVPEENEAEAIDLSFSWLRSANSNVTTKSRALFVLFNLTEKYPDLRNELRLSLQEQIGRNTSDFDNRAQKILANLAE